jgi:hypothetical protein
VRAIQASGEAPPPGREDGHWFGSGSARGRGDGGGTRLLARGGQRLGPVGAPGPGIRPYRFENPVTMYVPERWSFFSLTMFLRSASSSSSEKVL